MRRMIAIRYVRLTSTRDIALTASNAANSGHSPMAGERVELTRSHLRHWSKSGRQLCAPPRRRVSRQDVGMMLI